MKLRRVFLSLIFIASVSVVSGQKVIKKVAEEVCHCIDTTDFAAGTIAPDSVLSRCMSPILARFQKEIRKEYGDKFFDEDEDKTSYDFGIEVGKVMINRCDAFMSLISAMEEQAMDDVTSFYERAKKEAEAGEYEAALKNYGKAIEMDPFNFDYHNSRGVLYFKQGEYYRAISDFIAAAEVQPGNHLPYYNMAYSIYRLNDLYGALEEVQHAIQLNPDYGSSQNLRGLIYYQLNQYDSAELCYKKAVNITPSETTYQYNLALALYNQGKNEEALKWFLKAYKGDYENPNLLSYIGNCYNNLGNYELAIEFHTVKLFTGDTSSYIPFYNRGRAFFNAKNYTKALKDFKSAQAMDSTDIDVTYYLAVVHDSLGHYQTAETYYNRLIKENPLNAQYFDLRADFYSRTHNFHRAIQDYFVSIQLYPGDCVVYKNLGELHLKTGETEAAQYYFAKSKSNGCDVSN